MDNFDINIENLYDAYQKTLSAENTINDEKSVIYGYDKIKLPDEKNRVKGFQYNDELIRSEYINSINKLQKSFGNEIEGTVESTRKHIYKLMKMFSNSDESARNYFDLMQQSESNIINSFNTNVENDIQIVESYSGIADVKSNNHNSDTTINNVDAQSTLKTNNSNSHDYVENQFISDFSEYNPVSIVDTKTVENKFDPNLINNPENINYDTSAINIAK